MAIQYAQQPADQFRDLIPTFRNAHIVAAMQPLILLHQQIHSNGGLSDRSGSDDTFRNMVLLHVDQADKIRRRVTFNPHNKKLQALSIPIVKGALRDELDRSKDTGGEIDESHGDSPFGGDVVGTTTTQLIDLPWVFSGTDPSGTIALNRELEARFKSGPGYLVFGAVNEAIVAWTTIESRFRSKFITELDSVRMLGQYQQIVNYAMVFMGELNRVDVPEAVLASERPSGPTSAPNIVGEQSGSSAAN
jgi:hypothetical protein